MKQKISFIAIMAIALNANCVHASECIDNDCELNPIEITAKTESVEILEPASLEIDWTMPSTAVIETESVCTYDYNCPFDTESECEIWRKKPVQKTAVTLREPHINSVRVNDMLDAIECNINISANESVMSPLVERYKMLMRASNACCSEGIIHKMHENGANENAVYKFLKDDANYFAITQRCLVMDDSQISHNYSERVNGKMVADVRNACLCKNRQWFDSLLQPFNDIYQQIPEFANMPFTYEYTDGMQRNITVSINNDIQNAIGMLAVCPK